MMEPINDDLQVLLVDEPTFDRLMIVLRHHAALEERGRWVKEPYYADLRKVLGDEVTQLLTLFEGWKVEIDKSITGAMLK